MTPEKEFTFDEKKHIYYLDGKALTGVTTVLNVISKPALIPWAVKMAVEYVSEHLTDIVDAMNNSEPEKYNEILKEAKKAHTKKRDDAATKGTDIHSQCEEYINAMIKGEFYEIDADNDQLIKFVQWVKEHDVKFLASEKKMYSESLWLAGTCDFVAIVDGKKLVGDIKTTSGIYDLTPFMQCAAYRTMLEEMGETDFEGSVIVRLGKDGSFEERYRYDFETDKEGFLSALKLYRALATYKK